MLRPLAIAVVLTSLVACSSDKKEAAPAPTDVSTSSTSTSAATTSTTSKVPVPRTCSKDAFSGSSGPAPQQGAALTDGRYFGYVTSVDAAKPSIAFDVAQLFTGAAAAKAASEDGGESPPPNDYWIRNNTKAARTLQLAADAALCVLGQQGGVDNHPVSRTAFAQAVIDAKDSQGGMPAWIDVRSGTVERVENQFFP